MGFVDYERQSRWERSKKAKEKGKVQLKASLVLRKINGKLKLFSCRCTNINKHRCYHGLKPAMSLLKYIPLMLVARLLKATSLWPPEHQGLDKVGSKYILQIVTLSVVSPKKTNTKTKWVQFQLCFFSLTAKSFSLRHKLNWRQADKRAKVRNIHRPSLESGTVHTGSTESCVRWSSHLVLQHFPADLSSAWSKFWLQVWN